MICVIKLDPFVCLKRLACIALPPLQVGVCISFLFLVLNSFITILLDLGAHLFSNGFFQNAQWRWCMRFIQREQSEESNKVYRASRAKSNLFGHYFFMGVCFIDTYRVDFQLIGSSAGLQESVWKTFGERQKFAKSRRLDGCKYSVWMKLCSPSVHLLYATAFTIMKNFH